MPTDAALSPSHLAPPGRPYAPPRIPALPDGSGAVRRTLAALRNPIASVPEAAYRDTFVMERRGAYDVVFLTDPEALEEVLVRRWRDFPKSEMEQRILSPFLGEGLLTAEGEDWRWKRRLSAPTFAPAQLSAMTPSLLAPFEALAAEWRAAAPLEADVDAAMVRGTLDVIEQVLFGRRGELDLAAVATVTAEILGPTSWPMLLAMLKAPEWLPYPGKGRQRRARNRARADVAAVVRQRRAALEASGAAPTDLADRLLAARDPETGRPLTDDDMVDMLLTLVTAGHETSAHSMSWTLYCLAQQPAVQDALARESRAAEESGALAAGDLAALPRLEAAVKETLRLFPVAPVMGRLAQAGGQLCGREVPAGALLIIPIYALQRHPRLWEAGDVFDPERFLRDPEPGRTRYMPFGAGPRICVGARLAMMETVLGLAALLPALRFDPVPGAPFDPLHRVTLKPRGGLRLRIAPRD